MSSKLLVDSIESRTGTGVLTPDRPAFHAHDASGAAHIELTHGSWQLVPFDTTTINTGGHYNTSTYKFVAPVAGLYFFYIQLYMAKEGGVRYSGIYKNGSAVAKSQVGSSTSTDDGTATATRILELSVNDYIQPYIYHSVDTSTSYYSNADGTYSYFMGYLIG